MEKNGTKIKIKIEIKIKIKIKIKLMNSSRKNNIVKSGIQKYATFFVSILYCTDLPV